MGGCVFPLDWERFVIPGWVVVGWVGRFPPWAGRGYDSPRRFLRGFRIVSGFISGWEVGRVDRWVSPLGWEVGWDSSGQLLWGSGWEDGLVPPMDWEGVCGSPSWDMTLLVRGSGAVPGFIPGWVEVWCVCWWVVVMGVGVFPWTEKGFVFVLPVLQDY